jgi:hypothetical protein
MTGMEKLTVLVPFAVPVEGLIGTMGDLVNRGIVGIESVSDPEQRVIYLRGEDSHLLALCEVIRDAVENAEPVA